MQNSARAIAIFVAIPIGWSLWGVEGVVWSIAASELAPLAVNWSGMIRYHMFSIVAEARWLFFVILGSALGFATSYLWQIIFHR